MVDPAELNFAWETKGDARAAARRRSTTTATATFLAWPAGTPLPAILVKDHEGDEGPVNFAVRGEMIVVDGVPREIVLRSGEDSATLTNQGPARAGPVRQPALAQAGNPPPRR